MNSAPFWLRTGLSVLCLFAACQVPALAQTRETGTAAATTPLPHPKPQGTPGSSVKRIRVDEALRRPEPSLPYAPTASAIAPTPAVEAEVALKARLADGTPPLEDGVTWRIFAADPDVTGELPLVATSSGGDASFRLGGGIYYAHAAYGRAGAVKRIEMRGENHAETLTLDAGGLRLTAVVGEDQPANPKNVSFEIFRDTADGERVPLVDDADESIVLRLNSGTYHVVSRYGSVNAIVRADIQVNAGKLTEATIRHKAAEVTLKLVDKPGGEALANTQWTVMTPAGDVLHNSVGAFPSIILAEGTYTAVARHGDDTYTREFEVEAALDRDVEVLLSNIDLRSTGMRLSR